MAPRVYIDGHAGTTGLRIREWMAGRDDVELVTLDDARRKDEGARREALRSSELAVLCLPDDAARDAAAWARSSATRLVDASSAHRVSPGWAYGLPELSSGQRRAIADAERVASPGCYPTAVILLLRPLVDGGLVAPESPIAIHALSGYSGGGRPMIERWEDPSTELLRIPFEVPYALDRVHKHIPEMQHHAGLAGAPQFVPAVGPFRCGMRVEIPLHARVLGPVEDPGKRALDLLRERYRDEPFVQVAPELEAPAGDEWRLDPRRHNDTNRISLHVLPHPSGHLLLVALLDNLGKGACGGAIQCLNLMLGLDETNGLPR